MTRPFLWLWSGQLVSLFGSGLTRFALGVWVYQRTGSVTQFALIAMFAKLPGLLAAPVAGALVDRWDRRRVMLLSDTAAALTTAGLVILWWQGALVTWHIYVFVGIASLLEVFQWPAYTASTTLLVPKRHLGRASGMIAFGHAIARTAAPATAGLVIVTLGLAGVLWIDVTTFLFAALTLLLVRIPRPPAASGEGTGRGSLWREARYGWDFICHRPGLLGLLIYFAVLNLVIAVVQVLVLPMVLAFAAEALLGLVLAASGGGLVAGSAAMIITGGPRRRIRGILAAGLVSGLALGVAGLRPDAWLIGGALFAMMSCIPIVNACSQAIWQSKVPPGVQGRVFSVRRMIAQLAEPVGYLLAGPLADRLFGPLMAQGGSLAAIFGPWIGSGPGRGIGLLFLCLAAIQILGTLAMYRQPRVCRVEEELPDTMPG